MEQKRCISSLTLAELTAELKALGQPGFRAKQIFHWVHQKLVTEFSAMTDQPKTLLAKLEETFYIAAPQIERRQEAKDGTVKYLLRMADGNCIETVVMRYHYGNTVCVSTQVGCRMRCRFCASTQAGRVRNLEAGEICSEIYTAQKDIGERISHIVLMGIGEPLIYGVTFPLGRPFIGACIGGAFGGAVQALAMVGVSTMGISGLPLAAVSNNIPMYLAGLLTAYVVGFAATWLLGFEDPEEE